MNTIERLKQLKTKIRNSGLDRDLTYNLVVNVVEIQDTASTEIDTLKARIAELEAKAVPEGYQLMPNEPTEHIIESMLKENDSSMDMVQVYKAALAAAKEQA